MLRGEEEPWKTGSLFNASGTLLGVVACNCSTDTTVSGVGDCVASEITREPVTTTVSTVSASCACAATDKSASALVAVRRRRPIFERILIDLPVNSGFLSFLFCLCLTQARGVVQLPVPLTCVCETQNL